MAEVKRTFTDLIDLAEERLGGQVLHASDEFFAPAENLLKPGRGEFKPDLYTDHGKWMDGWESRRRRSPGHDFCLIRLGLPGAVMGANIDINHFLGNHPPQASLEACNLGDPASLDDLLDPGTAWTELLPKVDLEPGAENLFEIASKGTWDHLRFNIYPDGGVARLRIHGLVTPRFLRAEAGEVDLAAVENGGLPVACSDMFFSHMQNLIMPGPSKNMGDGWETRRKREPGNDWRVIRLGAAGRITRMIVETTHFKGNFPEACSLDGCRSEQSGLEPFDPGQQEWTELLPPTNLAADSVHEFGSDLLAGQSCTHVRLNIYPDGGIARLRLLGQPD